MTELCPECRGFDDHTSWCSLGSGRIEQAGARRPMCSFPGCLAAAAEGGDGECTAHTYERTRVAAPPPAARTEVKCFDCGAELPVRDGPHCCFKDHQRSHGIGRDDKCDPMRYPECVSRALKDAANPEGEPCAPGRYVEDLQEKLRALEAERDEWRHRHGILDKQMDDGYRALGCDPEVMAPCSIEKLILKQAQKLTAATARAEKAEARERDARSFILADEERRKLTGDALFAEGVAAQLQAKLDAVALLPRKWEHEASETDGGHRGEAKRFALQACAADLDSALAVGNAAAEPEEENREG